MRGRIFRSADFSVLHILIDGVRPHGPHPVGPFSSIPFRRAAPRAALTK
ncbi:hypothetical protein HMPREF9440_01134 [Sutterella parvirubra YIT 11816]|uniref:Uncharacterized protein n=1 Tax=Sutterella parvirubra YIT 11816 TaxID=762967 RepID=H3KEH0_9BURK|nr:hypothetical protein HMPREF9440_01134 [Sutterella parvirubra YIT 11816]